MKNVVKYVELNFNKILEILWLAVWYLARLLRKIGL